MFIDYRRQTAETRRDGTSRQYRPMRYASVHKPDQCRLNTRISHLANLTLSFTPERR